MFTEKESFTLIMDGVNINGTIQDGVSIFGEEAVLHMADVKNLFADVLKFSIIGAAALLICFLYIVLRKKHTAPILLKQIFSFYGFFILIALLFCGISFWQTKTSGLSFANQAWKNLHYVFFSMQSEKIEGSFFADALTNILTIDFFLSAIQIVVAVMASVCIVWFLIAVISKMKSAFKKRKAERFYQ